MGKKIQRPKIFKLYWLPYPYVFLSKCYSLLRTNVSGELKDHLSSGLCVCAFFSATSVETLYVCVLGGGVGGGGGR